MTILTRNILFGLGAVGALALGIGLAQPLLRDLDGDHCHARAEFAGISHDLENEAEWGDDDEGGAAVQLANPTGQTNPPQNGLFANTGTAATQGN